MKQTAVQWLQEQLKKGVDFNPLDSNSYLNEVEKLFEQAKAMEKEQMEGAVSNGISKADMVDNRGYFNFDKWYNETYEANNYDAWDEVIDQLGDTNKMIDHIGEVNEMVDHVPDVGKKVEDDVEKLAAEFYPLNDELYPNSSLIRKAFVAGYNKAKSTLYTEEQVREAIQKARHSYAVSNDIIQYLNNINNEQ